MSVLRDKSARRMLPRWHLANTATTSPEFLTFASNSRARVDHSAALASALADFNLTPSLGAAGELLTFANIAGADSAKLVASEYINTHAERAPLSLLALVEPDAGTPKEPQGRTFNVATARALLRENPRNPAMWADLARHYASNGNRFRATRSMLTALQLAPNHRWIIRTAARLLVHVDDPRAAHDLIARHPLTKTDPWLMAAELACAEVANRPPKYWKQATALMREKRFPPLHGSELSAALGMMEFAAGKAKVAKRHFSSALDRPTENTLAQVSWLAENGDLRGELGLREKLFASDDAYEAHYRFSMSRHKFVDALDAAQKWSSDEPFATRPRVDVAFVASILDDYDVALGAIAEVARLRDAPLDVTTEMNRVFALLSSNRLSASGDHEISQTIFHSLQHVVSADADNAYHALANIGLWHYRFGNPADGKVAYDQAIEVATKRQRYDSAASAAVFAAREALLVSDPSVSMLMDRAERLVLRGKNAPAQFYLRKLQTLTRNPGQSDSILSAKNARAFESRPSVTFEYKTRSGISEKQEIAAPFTLVEASRDQK